LAEDLEIAKQQIQELETKGVENFNDVFEELNLMMRKRIEASRKPEDDRNKQVFLSRNQGVFSYRIV
jgi:hypothetical protein